MKKELTITMYGADWCPDCRRAKAYLQEHNIDFDFVDVDLDKEATSLVETINNGKRIIPTIIIGDKPHTNPDNQELAALLGINSVGTVIMYGADWCPDCRRAKAFLRDNNINFRFVDVDEHEWATDEVIRINKGKRIIPTILIDDVPHTNPDNEVLRGLLEIGKVAETKSYDVLIIGGGAAGLTASIYAQRDKFDTVILEKKNIGGNTFLTQRIENYPGFTNISGPELMDRMEAQARTYGADVFTGEEVKMIKKVEGGFEAQATSGTYRGRSVVLTMGSTYRTLDIPNEEELIGAGVHFCATCDGAFYRDLDVIVVGGGNSAVEESIFLAGFCKSVTIVNRNAELNSSLTYQEKLPTISNIKVLNNRESRSFLMNEDGSFKGLEVVAKDSGETEELIADGAFVFIGLEPNTQVAGDLVALNEQGFIVTSGLAETSVPGIFAAGDCREGAIAQVAAATGEGVLASYGIRDYLKSL